MVQDIRRACYSQDMSPCRRRFCVYNWTPINCYFMDNRFLDRPNDRLSIIATPPLDIIRARPAPPPRQILQWSSSSFMDRRPKQHLSADWFRKWGRLCLPKLADIIEG